MIVNSKIRKHEGARMYRYVAARLFYALLARRPQREEGLPRLARQHLKAATSGRGSYGPQATFPTTVYVAAG
jgi:hypothetical protein